MRRARNTKLTAGLASAVIALTGTVAVPPALAQVSVLEEIVITARKREETYQDVPIAVTVFDAPAIQDAGIEQPIDFFGLTPNATLVNTQNLGNAFITIRGISQARNSEPSVAVVIDGVLLSNPRAFNVELFDINHIEILKGPQGALYGRNAIAGAIIVDSRNPSDTFEARIEVGADSGPGGKIKASVSGPVSGTEGALRYRAAVSYVDTDGYIRNAFLDEEADPYRDISGRMRLEWDVSDRMTVDVRGTVVETDSQALYFNIVGDANDTSLPVRVNNPGTNDRDIIDVSIKTDYQLDFATISLTSAYNKTTELLTGDQFDFLPRMESFFFSIFGFDLTQSAYFEFESFSQEVRLTSPSDQRFRWVVGGYLIGTDRLATLGNNIDTGNGAIGLKHEPSTDPQHPQFSFLSDAQDNFAWSLFADFAYDVTEELEVGASVRYDKDNRENTTLTPQAFLPTADAFTGQVRDTSFEEVQPKFTIRYTPTDDLTLYSSWGRGFRSGGFNQTGVGAVAESLNIIGVEDIFDKETTETVEVGVKARLLGGRANASAAAYHTKAEGSPFFVFIAQNSTQNIGNIDTVKHNGFEVQLQALLAEGLTANFGFGFNDSKITRFADASVLGNEAPLVSRTNTNASLQYRRPLAGTGVDGFFRVDYERIGKTWWSPQNLTVRDPVNLVNLRLGIEGESWSLIGWVKNLTDKKYNAEFSPGGFVFKAKPRRWGIDLTKTF